MGSRVLQPLDNRLSVGATGKPARSRRSTSAAGVANSTSVNGRPRHSMAAVGGNDGNGRRLSRASISHRNPRLSGVANQGNLKDSVKRIIIYLSSHNYEHEISPKIFANPSQKVFSQVLEFLFTRIDPEFHWTDSGPEEDIPRMFKLLKYPYNIKKSSLKSLASSVTWPLLVAAVEYLVNLLMFEERYEEECEFENKGHERLFFDFLGQAYSRYLCGDNECEELVNVLQGHFQQENDSIESDINILKQVNTRISEELQNLKNDGDRVQKKEANIETLQEDVNKLGETLDNWENHVQQLTDTRDATAALVEEKRAVLKGMEEKKREILERIEKQDLKLEDVERLAQERRDLEENLKRAREYREHQQELVDTQEKEHSQKQSAMTDKARRYNDLAVDLKLAPNTAKNARGFDYELHFNPQGKNSKEILNSLDIKGQVKQYLMKLKITYQLQGKDDQSKQVDFRQDLERKKEANSERTRELSNIQKDIELRKGRYDLDKQEMQRELQRLHELAVENSQSAQKVLRTSQAECSKSLQTLEEAKIQYQQTLHRLGQEQDNFINRLTEALTLVMNHKSFITEKLEETQQRVAEDVERAMGLPIPT